MRGLKIATTTGLLLGLCMLIGWPLIVGPKPAIGVDRKVLAQYGVKLLTYFGLTALVFVAVAFMAWLLVRQTRKMYVEDAKKNIRGLVEGSLKDHERGT